MMILYISPEWANSDDDTEYVGVRGGVKCMVGLVISLMYYISKELHRGVKSAFLISASKMIQLAY
jgi:hypothetical protein